MDYACDYAIKVPTNTYSGESKIRLWLHSPGWNAETESSAYYVWLWKGLDRSDTTTVIDQYERLVVGAPIELPIDSGYLIVHGRGEVTLSYQVFGGLGPVWYAKNDLTDR